MTRISAYRLQSVSRAYEAVVPPGETPFAELLAKAGVPTGSIEGPDATVELLHEAAVVEAACRALGDKTFAARVGLAARVPGTLVAYLVRASDTLEEALKQAQRFYVMQDPDLKFGLAQSADGIRVTIGSTMIPAHQFPRHREMLTFGLYQRTRQITGDGLAPVVIELETDDLEHCRQTSMISGCHVEGEHTDYALRLPANALSFPIPTADPALLQHLYKHGEEQLRGHGATAQSNSDRTIALLQDRLPGRVPSGDDVAAELGMTRRTLTRRLAAEGTSYRALLEGVQCELSRRFLRNGESIAQIAFMLDFADQAAFSVAFKRWTGETPARFRRTKL